MMCFVCLVAGASAQRWLVGNGLMTFDSRWSNESFVDIAAGQYHALALRADGTVVAFGQNGAGQCDVPALPSGVTYVALAAGGFHSAAIRSDGQIVVWGDNSEGQHSVPALAAGTSWVELASGHYHLLARRSDGEVHCWGRSLFGLHNVPAPASGTSIVQIAAGANFCLWRRNDGEVVGWGENGAGQANVPSAPVGRSYAHIAAGQDHAVGIFDDGTGWAWGSNALGQSNMPPLPSGLTWVTASCGFHHSVARRSDGSLVAWGYDNKLQVSLPALPVGLSYVKAAPFGFQTILLRSDGRIVSWGEYQALPPELPPGVEYVMGSSRHFHAAALRSDGRVVAWGLNDYGQVSGIPALPLGMSYIAVGTGYRHSIALRNDGLLVGWGDNAYSQYGLYGLTNVAEISVGSWFTVARRTDGVVQTCGYNGDGQLGVASLPSGHVYTAIAAGGAHVLGGRSDGDLVGWGRNIEGQAGFGTMSPHAFVSVSAGNLHSAAVRSDGTLLAWGDNGLGQCNVPPFADFVRCAAGESFTLGLRSDGTLLAWGTNANRELAVTQAPLGFEVAHLDAGAGRAIVAYRPKSKEHVVRINRTNVGRTVFYDRNGDGRREFANAYGELQTWEARGSLGQILLERRYYVPGDAVAFGNLGSGTGADSVSIHAGALYFTRTDGSFGTVGIGSTEQLRHVVMCDVDGNGYQDAVVAAAGYSLLNSGSVMVCRNPWDPTGSMTWSVVPGGTGSILRVFAGDLDNDGDPDIAALSRGYPDRIQLYANNGAGAFTLADTIVLASNNEVADLEVVDLDQNGTLDFVVAAPSLLSGNNRLIYLARSGPGLVAASYTATAIALPSGHASELASGHFSAGDTAPALVCNDLVHGGVWVLHGYSAGSFATVEQRLPGIVANTIEVGDCNGDQFDDIGYSWFARSTYGVSLTLPEASLHAYGTGCAGASGIPIAGANGLPISGSTTFRLTVSQARATSIALLFGAFDQAALPLLPSSCTLLLDDPISLGFAMTSSGGSGSLPMPLPFGFGGVSLYFQWAVIDPTGAYGNFAAFSNGLRTQLGN
jgi:alpha-tubulin suppressor-like RCC1 family protein